MVFPILRKLGKHKMLHTKLTSLKNWTLHSVCWLTTTHQGCDPITSVTMNVNVIHWTEPSITWILHIGSLAIPICTCFFVLMQEDLRLHDTMWYITKTLKWICQWLRTKACLNLKFYPIMWCKSWFYSWYFGFAFYLEESITNATSPYVTESSRYHISQEHLPWPEISSFRRKAFQLSITILWTTRVCTFYVRCAKQSLQGNPPPELWCYNSKSRKPVALDLDSRQSDAFELIPWCNWTSNRKQVALNQESFARNATPRISGAEKLQKSLSSTTHLKGKSL